MPTTTDSLADRVTNATCDLTLLCDTLADIGPNPDVDSLTAEDKAEIEANLLATAQSILAVLHLAGHDVKGAIDCLADVVEALDAERAKPVIAVWRDDGYLRAELDDGLVVIAWYQVHSGQHRADVFIPVGSITHPDGKMVAVGAGKDHRDAILAAMKSAGLPAIEIEVPAR